MAMYGIWCMDRLVIISTLSKNFIFGLFYQFQKHTITKTNKYCAVISWHFFLDDKISEMRYWNGSYYQKSLIISLRLLNLTFVLHITWIRTLKSYYLFSYSSISTLNYNKEFSTLRNEHQLWKTTAHKRIELQTPDWSQFKEFKQLFKLKPIWDM